MATAQKQSILPSEPSSIITDMNLEKMLWYGAPGAGKSTTANYQDTLFLATEPGHGKMQCFKVDIDSWPKFGQVITELQTGNHNFKRIVIDTVDNLYLLCSRFKCAKLQVEHESDLKWGKGWSVVNKTFEVVIQNLSMLGLGIIFISHEKQVEVSTNTGEYKRFVPNLGGAALDIVGGYVDHIMRFAIVNDGDKAGNEKRMILVEPSQYYMSKSRGDKGIQIFNSNMEMSYAAMQAEYEAGIKKLMEAQNENA